MVRKSFLTIMTLMAFLWNLASFADDTPVIAAASDLSYVLSQNIRTIYQADRSED